MRIAKCVGPVLVAALVGVGAAAVASGQDNTAQQPSNITADCLVKITVDPSVLPLNMGTLEGLLHSSAVRGKAMTEVLGPGRVEDNHQFIFVEWLSGTGQNAGAKMPGSSIEQEMDDAMMRQYEEIYGEEYARLLGTPAGTPEKKGGAATAYGMGGSGGMVGGTGGAMMMTGPERGGMSGTGARGGMMGGMSGTGARGGMMGGVSGTGTRGRTMGGMGGGMGMGGGGMSMGMGGMGMGTMYGTSTGSENTATVERNMVVRLTVALPDEFGPVAKELLGALVVNLRNSLVGAHDKCVENLEGLLASAKLQQNKAEQNIQSGGAATSPETTRVREQLDTTVDLSSLSSQTPFSEAIEVLKNAVNPPLQIVALWRDLLDQANVEPSTPIDTDGMSHVRLGTALDLLLKGISGTLHDDPPVVYRVKDNVIVIGTRDALQMPSASATGQKGQTDIRVLATQKNELARAIQSLELDMVSMEARRKAMYRQMEEASVQADRRLAQDTVTQELEKLVQISTSHLELLQQRVTAGQMPQAELASAQESVARARIELARRREELTKLTGGGRIEQYDGELSKMAIDEAESRARLEVLRKQLADVQGQLTQASTFDPEAARIRIAQETLDLTNRRVGELETRLATLQPPTVTIIGDN